MNGEEREREERERERKRDVVREHVLKTVLPPLPPLPPPLPNVEQPAPRIESAVVPMYAQRTTPSSHPRRVTRTAVLSELSSTARAKWKAGWAKVLSSTRWHYFDDDGNVLCLAWYVVDADMRTYNGIPGGAGKACKTCTRKLAKGISRRVDERIRAEAEKLEAEAKARRAGVVSAAYERAYARTLRSSAGATRDGTSLKVSRSDPSKALTQREW